MGGNPRNIRVTADAVNSATAHCELRTVRGRERMRRGWILAASLMVAACTGGADNGAVQTTLGDAAPATPTETTTTTSESRAATTTEAPLVGESSLDSPIQLGTVVQVGSWRLRVSAITPDGTDEVMEENKFNDPPPEGNQFFIASLEATYTGTESSTFWVDMTLKSVGDSNVGSGQ